MSDWFANVLDARRAIDEAMWKACRDAIRDLPAEQKRALAEQQMIDIGKERGTKAAE